MKRKPWVKLSELQQRYVPPRARGWLIAMAVIRPAATLLSKLRLAAGTAVLRTDEGKKVEK